MFNISAIILVTLTQKNLVVKQLWQLSRQRWGGGVRAVMGAITMYHRTQSLHIDYACITTKDAFACKEEFILR